MFRPGTLIILALLALVGAGVGARQYAPQYLPDRFTTDEILAERMGERLREEPMAAAFAAKFEELFPADYEELMRQLVILWRRGGTQEQASVLGESYMTRFIEDNKHHTAAADPESLMALGRALSVGMSALRRESPTLCALYMQQGNVPPQMLETLSDETKQTFIDVTVAMLDAIAAGKRAPTQYAEPSEAQWVAWLARYDALGGDQNVLAAMNSPSAAAALSPSQTCEAADLTWTAVLSAEDDFAPRFISYSMGL